ncbi:hypothetical protein KJ644_00310 [Candidatus Dependentiae bacterium]|nr:hypothetical protein [Candidatus Dependentiae bacterium]MBU4386902.1 hypothetical protein [Candidatus Dependentiae bacterium]MCG2756378.1 hypothetical protein [Candidatus Dependentiae bacterium]
MAETGKVGKWFLNNMTGILAVISGLVLLGFTYKIILNIILFTVGVALTYFGLVKINASPIINFIDKMIRKIKASLKE